MMSVAEKIEHVAALTFEAWIVWSALALAALILSALSERIREVSIDYEKIARKDGASFTTEYCYGTSYPEHIAWYFDGESAPEVIARGDSFDEVCREYCQNRGLS